MLNPDSTLFLAGQGGLLGPGMALGSRVTACPVLDSSRPQICQGSRSGLQVSCPTGLIRVSLPGPPPVSTAHFLFFCFRLNQSLWFLELVPGVTSVQTVKGLIGSTSQLNGPERTCRTFPAAFFSPAGFRAAALCDICSVQHKVRFSRTRLEGQRVFDLLNFNRMFIYQHQD